VAPLVKAGGNPSVDEIIGVAGISRATFYRLFDSRGALLLELQVAPPESSHSRIMAAAMEIIGKRGLAALNMDELAVAAEVSRANLYRLFPGKGALLRELIREYSPMETVTTTIAALASEPPEVVMPTLARAVGSVLGEHPGLARTLFYEVTGGTSDVTAAIEWALHRAIAAMLGYISDQMAAGRLRETDPLLALQSFIGPLFFHLMTRPIALERLGLTTSVDDAMTALGESWILSMKPQKTARSAKPSRTR
jgi:AcrR family transcriptional regulator